MQIHNQHREITTVIHLPAMNELELMETGTHHLQP